MPSSRQVDDDTLGALLERRASEQPDAPAILAPGREALGYGALWQQVQDVAAALQSMGMSPSDRVAIVLPNGPEMATAFLACAACAACAPLNPGYQAAEFRFYLEDLGARVVIVQRGETGPVKEVARELGLALMEIDADPARPAGRFGVGASHAGEGPAPWLSSKADTALILHTSGTTARPKIVPLSQANLLASAHNIARHLALQPRDRCLNVMPLFHIHGLIGALLATLAAGGSIVCTPGFDERLFFDRVAEFEPTWYTAVPTIHQSVLAQGALYRQKAPRHRFRFVRSSSAALPPKTFDMLEALTGAPVIEAYGMTEASHQMASNPLPPRQRKPGSVGIPAGVEIALMDEAGQVLGKGCTGEIVIRGPGVTAGYESNPVANAKAFTEGWFRTGDQGRLDDDGYLFICGRLKEIVNRGGEKISPREVDEALIEHPDVAQAVAFAVPHGSLGEDLVAAVVLRAGAAPDEAALRAFLFERLAGFKVPSAIVFVDAIPKGPTGKVQRTSLHEKLRDRLATRYVAPRTELERSLASVFAELLERDGVGVHDNFFALGGDSLKGTRVMARINARHGVELAVPSLFRHPTIAALALEIDAAQAAAAREDEALAAEIATLSDEDVARLLAASQAGG
ncbi:MAG TPA: AMP-binding protein [Albitalea sp.]|nr:AMP-binding protein [Albitalea sp.]